MILVTTAGKVGAEAVRSLTLREVPVRVLVRNPGTHQHPANRAGPAQTGFA